MKRAATLFVLIAAAVVLGACAPGTSYQTGQPCPNCPRGGTPTMEKAPQSAAAIYWCDCGRDCKCDRVSTKPGKCACGKEMAGGHVIWVEGTTALVCTCGPGCTCAIDPNDHTKCGCGKPVKRVELKGTGLYFCNCGGSCGCNSISDKPGPCSRCGMQMRQSD